MASIASSHAPQALPPATFQGYSEAPPQSDLTSTKGSTATTMQGSLLANTGDAEMGEVAKHRQGDDGDVIGEKETIEDVEELAGAGQDQDRDDTGSLQDAEGEDDDTMMYEGAGAGGEGTSVSSEQRRGPERSGQSSPTTQNGASDETELGSIEKPKRRRSTSVKKQQDEEDDEFDPSGDGVKDEEASDQEEPSDYDEAESGRVKKKPKVKQPGRSGRPPAPTAVPLVKAENPRDPAKIWECIIGECQKAFVRKNDLQRHIKSHNNIREFQCSFENCNKAFLQRSALHVHERVHTGEQPYACETCERRFADTSSLARHRRIHTGARPYKCEVPGCGRDFCRKITLQNHISSQHPPDGVAPLRKKRAKKSESVDGTEEGKEEGNEAPVKVKKPRKKKDEKQDPADPSEEQANPPAPKPKRVRKPKAPKVDVSPPPPTAIPAAPTRTVPKRARVVPPRYADSPPPSSSFAQPPSAPPSDQPPQQAPIAWSLPPPRSVQRAQLSQSDQHSPHRPSTPIVENRQSLYHLPESIQPVDDVLNQRVEEALEQLYQFACAEEVEEDTSSPRCSSVPPPSIPFQPISTRSTLSEPPLSPRPFFSSLKIPSQTFDDSLPNGSISFPAANGALEEEEEDDLYA